MNEGEEWDGWSKARKKREKMRRVGIQLILAKAESGEPSLPADISHSPLDMSPVVPLKLPGSLGER